MGLVRLDQPGQQREQCRALLLAQRRHHAVRHGACRRREFGAQREPGRRQAVGIGPPVLRIDIPHDQSARFEARQGLTGGGGVDPDRGGEPVAVPPGRIMHLREERDLPWRDIEGCEGLTLEGRRDLPQAPRQMLRKGPMQRGDGQVRGGIIPLWHKGRILRI